MDPGALPWNDVGGFLRQIGLTAGNETLPVDAKQVDRLARTEKHADSKPVGNPANEAGHDGNRYENKRVHFS